MAGQLVLSHEPMDLNAHPNSHVQKPHMHAVDAFRVAREPAWLQDALKHSQALCLSGKPRFFKGHPVLVAGAGDAGQFAQPLHGQDLVPLRQRGANGCKWLSADVPLDRRTLTRTPS